MTRQSFLQRQKSKKEVMEDIISKSKFFKVVVFSIINRPPFNKNISDTMLVLYLPKFYQAQKAKDKEENEQYVEQLDKDFMSLVQSEALLSLTQPSTMGALKSFVNKSISYDGDKIVETSSGQKKNFFQRVYFYFK